ncbi:TIGR00725 family protein [Spirillospora sp. NPDC048911]|uniref:TIGR00725 family protein n=1 Tax=Spirillospora sp. NPDC048911 TaxID=3364527 RepID=UPI0037242D64
MQVAVCGPRACSEEEWQDACTTGRLLAERQAVVICGGQGGVMAAVAAGARSAGGIVVGVLPAADRSAADPALTVAIPTGLGEARNSVIVNAADAVIVVGGSWGTLSELALAMRAGRVPVVQLGGWHVLDERGRPLSAIRHASSPRQALDLTGLWS